MVEGLPVKFGEHVSRVLVVYQLIESNLKLYITFSFKLIRVKLGPSIPFEYDGSEFDNLPLGRLITIFDKLTDNKTLVKSLHAIKNDRDYIAHQSLVAYLASVTDEQQHEIEVKRIIEIAVEAWACFSALQGDLEALEKRINNL